MAKEFDHLAAAREATEKILKGKKPARTPLDLNPTASWCFGDARILFETIVAKCDLATARGIFLKCIEIAAEQEQERAAVTRKRQDVELPPAAEIKAMADRRVRTWWRRIQDNGQAFEGDQKQSLIALAERYLKCGGYQGSIPPMPPPLKKIGARRRNTPKAAELPAMFKALKIKHPRLSYQRIAEIIAKQHGTVYGKSAEAIERAEREWRKKNRKV
jgi:hypothetical protein